MTHKISRSMHGVPFEQKTHVRVGFVGVGWRGQSLINEMLYCEGVEIAAIADLRADMLDMTTALLAEKGQQRPAVFHGKGS
jgi:predicted homoserine dehydrogenase-like protein